MILKINVEKDDKYRRENDNIVTDIEIDLFQAIFGSSLKFKFYNDENIELNINTGTQSEDKIHFSQLVTNLFLKNYCYLKIKNFILFIDFLLTLEGFYE